MKKILALVACLSILATLAVGGSIAYLQDSDSDTNVMTMGNVDIEQEENFEQEAPLLPGTTVTKEVTVKNVGVSDAYVRTFVAFENDPDNIVDFTKYDTNEEDPYYSKDWTWRKLDGTITVDDGMTDVVYDVYEVVYNDKLPKDVTTTKSLLSVSMKPEATNGQVKKFNTKYNVLVLSQAVQTVGFDETGLETFDEKRDNAFKASFQNGEDLTVAMVEEWFKAAKATEQPLPPSSGDADTLTKAADVYALKTTEEQIGAEYEVYQDFTANLNGESLTNEGLGNQLYFSNATLNVTDAPAFKFGKTTVLLLADCNIALSEGQKVVVMDGVSDCVIYYSNLSINGVTYKGTGADDYFDSLAFPM